MMKTFLPFFIIGAVICVITYFGASFLRAKNVASFSSNLSNSTVQTNPINPLKVLPPANGILLAANPDFGDTEDVVTKKAIQNYTKSVGRNIVWAYFSNNWYNGIVFPKKSVQIIHDLGIIPFIRMMPRSNDDDTSSETEFTLQKITDGKFDKELIAWAQDAKSENFPIMVEFGTEVNGDWFPWSGVYNGGAVDGPKRFVAAYRHIITLFRQQNVTNITWAYHVNVISSPDEQWNSLEAYYPGDDYIDWIGVSNYGAINEQKKWTSFTDNFISAYPKLTALSPNKPIAVLEFGVEENAALGSKAEWIHDALQAIASGRYPRIKAISYWNDKWVNEDDTISNLRIDSSPESLAMYKKMIALPEFIDKW